MIEYLVFGILITLLLGYLVLDYLMLKNGHDLSRRLKYLVIPLVCFPLGGLMLWMYVAEIADAIDMAENGIETEGIVNASKTEKKQTKKRLKTEYINTIFYDKYEKNFSLDKEYPVGSQFYIVYSSKNPNNAKLSRLKNNFAEYFLNGENTFLFFAASCTSIFCFFIGIKCIVLLFKSESVLDAMEK